MAKRQPQIVNGVLFKHIKAVAIAHGVGYGPLQKHVRRGMTWQQSLDTLIANRDRDFSFHFAGKQFRTQRHFTSFYGLHKDSISRRTRGGMEFNKALRAALVSHYTAAAPSTRLKICRRCGAIVNVRPCDCQNEKQIQRIRRCSNCGAAHERIHTGKRHSLCPNCISTLAPVFLAKSKAIRREKVRQLRRDGLIQSGHHHRRHKLHGTKIIDKTITARRVAEKYGYACQVCGRTVERHLGKAYQPLGWTIGHIIPLAHGGSTAWDNVQCECVQCNSWKANSQRANPPWSILPITHISAA